MWKKLAVGLALAPVVAIAYKLYVWAKFRRLMLDSGLPVLHPDVVNSPIAYIALIAKNFNRLYDFKLERMQQIRPAALTAFSPSTIASKRACNTQNPN